MWYERDGRLLAIGVTSPYFWILVLLALIVAAALWRGSRRQTGGRADRLMETYRHLDEATLAGLPDDQLVEAVAANLLAKLDKRRPDPVHTLPLLSQGRCAVYGAWALTCALQGGDLAAYLHSTGGKFAGLTCDGLELLGADGCAQALRAALEADTMEGLAATEEELRAAIEREQPLARCVAYIRDNPAEFIDD